MNKILYIILALLVILFLIIISYGYKIDNNLTFIVNEINKSTITCE